MSVKAVGSLVSPPWAIGDVVFALHLDQAGDGALEFEGTVTGGINFLGRNFGRGDQQGSRFVECVDQNVEAAGLVALLRGEAWDGFDDDCREAFGDCEVIGRGKRLRAGLRLLVRRRHRLRVQLRHIRQPHLRVPPVG